MRISGRTVRGTDGWTDATHGKAGQMNHPINLSTGSTKNGAFAPAMSAVDRCREVGTGLPFADTAARCIPSMTWTLFRAAGAN